MPERAPESLPSASFAPGEQVGRFELLRELGRGGFGIVFEARDLQLGRLVAIKSMRAHRHDAPEADWAARFKIEAQAVARLNHPNIVTLYDHGVHRTVPFLVLELLAGETLQERISRGPLPALAALELVVQVVRALVHAHHLGIVHRDLKPANVVLGRDGVVSVLDFGLAQVRDALEAPPVKHDAARFSSLPGAGTVSFMSPEQSRGEAEDERTDIFAIGVMLRVALGDELSVALRPSTERSALLEGGREAQGAPSLPPAGRQIPKPLAEVIRRATALAPRDRFSTSAELLEALVAARLALGDGAQRAGWPRRRHLLLLLGAAIALGAVAAALGPGSARLATPPALSTPPQGLPAAATSSAPRRAIAILGFENLAGRPEAAWLSTALGVMLKTELSAGEQLRAIEAGNLTRAAKAPVDEASSGTGALATLGTRLAADYFVSGSYLLVAGDSDQPARIRIDLRLQGAQSGETLAVIGEQAALAELTGLSTRLGAALRQRLGVGPLTSIQEKQVRASLPSQIAVVRLYAEGLARLRSFDNSAARELFRQAVALEPGFPMAHLALAEVLWTLGDEAPARIEAKRALALSEELPPAERLLVEGRYWETAGEAYKAVEVYERLFRDYPDDADHGFRLLRAQWRAGNPAAMASTLERLHRLSPAANEDLRIFQGEARLATVQDDRRHALAAAQALIARGRAEGAQALVYEGVLFEGAEHRNRGAYELALRSFREGLAIGRAIGDNTAVVGAQVNIAVALVDQGRLREARKSYAAIDAVAGEVRGALAVRLVGLGSVALRQGNLAGARSRFAAGLEAARKSEGHKYAVAQARQQLANWAHAAGELVLANELAGSALQAFRGLDWPAEVAFTLSALGATLAAQGDRAGARARVEEALAIWQRRDSPVEVARSRSALASVALDDERAAEAEALAQQALEMFERAPPLGDERALARAVLAEALWALGKQAEAQRVVGQLEASEGATSGRSERLEVRLRVALARALVLDDPSAVQGALALASRAGLAEVALRARLLSATLAKGAGRRRLLRQVAADAAARGFATIARKARAALGERVQ